MLFWQAFLPLSQGASQSSAQDLGDFCGDTTFDTCGPDLFCAGYCWEGDCDQEAFVCQPCSHCTDDWFSAYSTCGEKCDVEYQACYNSGECGSDQFCAIECFSGSCAPGLHVCQPCHQCLHDSEAVDSNCRNTCPLQPACPNSGCDGFSYCADDCMTGLCAVDTNVCQPCFTCDDDVCLEECNFWNTSSWSISHDTTMTVPTSSFFLVPRVDP
jgi:hypothetical protein